MHFKHGKLQFSKRDTYDLNETLKPVIYQAVKRFKEVYEESNMKAIPYEVLKTLAEEGKITTVDHHYSEDDLALGVKRFIEILDEMLYAFGSEEPDVDFKNMGQFRNDEGLLFEHYDRCQKGYKLFGEYFDSLWW